MPGFGDILGKGSIGEQLFIWGLMSQVVQAMTAPGIDELQQSALFDFPVTQLSPAELATAVNRGFRDRDAAAAEARRSGVNESRFATLVDLAGEAPGPYELVEALRRGIITEHDELNGIPSFTAGIAQGNLRDVWAPMMKALAVQPPSPAEAVDALVKGQITAEEAHARFIEAGGDPTWWRAAFDTAGEGPAPMEAINMARRGIIPWDGVGPGVVSYAQAFHEGRWRNKWQTAFRGLAEYLPPPRTVTALLREGVITPALAAKLFMQAGLSHDLAAAYVASAQAHHTTAAKELTRGDIVQLYTGHVLTAAQATEALARLGYKATDAALVLSGADLKRTITTTNAAVSSVRSRYVAHRIEAGTAAQALKDLGIDAGEASALVAEWEIERAANVHPLTPAQVVDAWHLGILSQADATAELVHIGYTAWDAWVLLSIKNKAPLPGEPPRAF